MKMSVLFAVIVMLVSTAGLAQTEVTYAEVDQEMIQLLDLDEAQAIAYREVIHKARQRLLELDSGSWQQELAVYRELIGLLKPVLSSRQHAQFVGILNSAIEYTEEDFHLAREYQLNTAAKSP